MPTLRELTETIQQRPGVAAVVLLGADGLVIETHADASSTSAEALAARVPGVVMAARKLATAAAAGDFRLAVLEFEDGYGVVLGLSREAMLFVNTSRQVELGDLLFDLRSHRGAMAALV